MVLITVGFVVYMVGFVVSGFWVFRVLCWVLYVGFGFGSVILVFMGGVLSGLLCLWWDDFGLVLVFWLGFWDLAGWFSLLWVGIIYILGVWWCFEFRWWLW